MIYYPRLSHIVFLAAVAIAVAAVWEGTKPEHTNAYGDEVDKNGVSAVLVEGRDWKPKGEEGYMFVGPRKPVETHPPLGTYH